MTKLQREEVLNSFKISMAEWVIMTTLEYGSPCRRDLLVAEAVGGSIGDSVTGELNPDCCEVAISTCVSRGWLKILTDQDCLQDLEMRNAEAIPCVPLLRYLPGMLEFTEAGFASFVNVQRATGESKPQYAIFDESEGYIYILAETRETCEHWKQIVVKDLQAYCHLGEDARILYQSDSVSIGAWRRSRFELFSKGYRSTIQYDGSCSGPRDSEAEIQTRKRRR